MRYKLNVTEGQYDRLPNLENLGLDPEIVQSLRPRLSLTFGEDLGVSWTTLESTGNSVRCSLEAGEETALRVALDALDLDVRRLGPVVEIWLPLHDVRVSRGMAGATCKNGEVGPQDVEQCAARAREAAADVPPGWAGTRIWGDIAEIAVDGATPQQPLLDAPMPGNKLRVEVLEAFYRPEVEAARTAMLEACGLAAPTFLHLSCAGRPEVFTTQEEQQNGIAVLWIAPSGTEVTVSIGGHIVALADFPTPPIDPASQLLAVSAWLEQRGWNKTRLPLGIRLLGRGLERAWLDAIQANIPLPVSLPEAPEVARALTQALFRNSMIQFKPGS